MSLLTTNELAAQLRVTPGTVCVWNRLGIITPEVGSGRGSRTLYDIDRVIKQLAKRKPSKAGRKAKLEAGMVPVI